MKGMDVAVTEAIKESIDGTFSNELYVGTLENDGVGLAPYHDSTARSTQELDGQDRGPQGADHRRSITITPADRADAALDESRRAGAGSAPRPGSWL